MGAQFLKKTALISRSGIYEYLATELPGGPTTAPPGSIVRVYRSEDEVFSDAALKSFEHLPLTIGHPSEGVTPENFRDVTHGYSLSPVTRAGSHARVEIALMSADAIAAYKAGRRQLSAGYRMDLVWKPGVTTDGQPFDAQQKNIRGNHNAIVKAGRAGSAAIIDEEKEIMTFEELKAQVAAAEKLALDEKVRAELLVKERDTLAGQVAALTADRLTEEQLAAKVADGVAKALAARKTRDEVIAKAKKCAPSLVVGDDMPIRKIQEAAIKARRSDVVIADEHSAEYVAGIFAALTTVEKASDAKPNTIPATGRILPSSAIRELYTRV